MSASRIIIEDDDRLDNVHPGDILREDFLIGTEISVADVAAGSGVEHARIEALLRCEAAVDAETALRLSLYFGLSGGFFLGLQNDYDLEEVWRRDGGELDRITPRAA